MEQTVTYLSMVQKFINLQQKIQKLIHTTYAQVIFQKDFSASNIKKTRFNGYVYDFSIDHNPSSTDSIKDVRKYLMKKKWNSIKMLKFVKQIFISTLMFFNSLSSVNPLECVSMSNEKCKVF